MKKLILLLIFAFFCQFSLFSQNNKIDSAYLEKEKDGKLLLYFVPHNLIFNGLRLDFDIRMAKSAHWISLAPQIYYREKNDSPDTSQTYYYSDDRDFDNMKGAGLDVCYRYYINGEGTPRGGFMSVGLGYTFYQIQYWNLSWVNVPFGSSTAMMKKWAMQTQDMHQCQLSVFLGINWTHWTKLHWELYGGAAFRYTFMDENVPKNKRFNDYYWDYGYRGVALIAGIRIGVLLK